MKRMKRIKLKFVPLFILAASAAVLAGLLSSCGVRGAGTDTGSPDSTMDTGSVPEVPMSEEVRGVYIATVYNIDFPSEKGLDAKTLASELDGIVEMTSSLGCNAIYFQVRGASDAMYDSDIFPVSEFLTGEKDGELPDGFDPLSYLVGAAHAKGIAVHAWVNPLRVTRGGTVDAPKTDVSLLPEGSPARKSPELTLAYAGELYLDPGIPEARQLVADGVRELVRGYDIDGVLFDDYFYPYPKTGLEVPDGSTYEKYGSGEDIGDFRRDNINKMVKECYDAIKSEDGDCLFGIAPFGIWQNNDGKNGGSDTHGLESYTSLFCDTLAWAEGGYVDYIAPQIYWSFSHKSAPYGVIAEWWNAALDGTGVDLLISHAAYKYGTDEWSFAGTVGELTEQLSYSRELLTYRGSLLYGFSALSSDTDGVGTEARICFSERALYPDEYRDDAFVKIEEPENGSEAQSDTVVLHGKSAPGTPVVFEGKKLSRRRDGDFYLTVKLGEGTNVFEFTSGREKVKFRLRYSGK